MPRVSRQEAARRLSVVPGTIYYWCKKHPELIGDDGKVDLEELRAHRDAMSDKQMSRAGKSSKAKAYEGIESRSDAVLRRERAKADEAELNLAERLGKTLRREEVEAAIADAALQLKQEAFRAVKQEAEVLARIDDPREMEKALEAVVRDLLEAGANALAGAVGPGEVTDAA